MTREEKVIEVAKQVLSNTHGRGVFTLINDLKRTGLVGMVNVAEAIETILGANGSCFIVSDGGGKWQFNLPKSVECDRQRKDWSPMLECMGYYLPRGSSDWSDQSEVEFKIEIDRSKRREQNPLTVNTFEAFMDALKILEDSSKESSLSSRIILDEAIDEWFPLRATIKKED